MGRDPKPSKGKAKPAVSRKSPKNEDSKVRDLEKRLAEALRDKAEAQDQHTATSEVLEIIRRSPSDVQPVFEMIAENAARLCDAVDVTIFQIDSNVLRVVVHKGPIPSASAGQTRPLVRETPTGRAVLDRRTVHVADVQAEIDEYPEGSIRAQRLGYRTILAAPLLRVGEATGAIVVRRTDVSPFTDRQVALLHTFANQAAIAIENVRLFKEVEVRNKALTEALEQQTATAEIVRVISHSPMDLQTVLNAVSGSAARLCDASDAVILLAEGTKLITAAHYGKGFATAVDRPVTRDSVAGRAVLDRAAIHVADVQAADDFSLGQRLARADSTRTALAMPLILGDVAIGAMLIRRGEIRLFSDKQIALLKTFADEAVIAIENTRLFNETKEALERQTATSEILRVISSSPTNIQPVFDAIAESANRLCDALYTGVFRFDAGLIHFAAHNSWPEEALAVFRADYPAPATDANWNARAILERRVMHVRHSDAEPGLPVQVAHRARALGIQSYVAVPMLREGEAIGTITVSRAEVGGFSDTQIALLQTFADQAVIAIENVRLFTELQASNRELSEALEQQTATSEILGVISQSPTDVQPVFDAIARSTARLCEASNVMVFRVDGKILRLAAQDGPMRAGDVPLHRGTVSGRAVLDRQLIHLADAQARVDDFPEGSALARQRGIRTSLSVPLLREGMAIGIIQAQRNEVRPFSDQQVSLLKTFADQAVIAIENVRLFTELQQKNQALTQAHAQVSEALEQQTATGEILRLIAGSPTDLESVLGTVAETAARVCGARDAIIYRCDAGVLRLACTRGPLPSSPSSLALPLNEKTVTGRSVVERRTIHVHDLAAVAASEYPEALSRGVAAGSRTVLATPLLQDGEPLGAILIRRGEVQAFTDKQIALLKTFADQAVIAIENVRLFTELQEKNLALTQAHAQVSEALDHQTATAEILRVISQSPTDLRPVFDTIVRNAVQLCGATYGSAYRIDGDVIYLVAEANLSGAGWERFRMSFPRPLRDGGVLRDVVESRRPQYLENVDAYPFSEAARALFATNRTQSLLTVPMIRQDQVIGAFSLFHPDLSGFPDGSIDLVRTFADQAVIAIENVRLFKELDARTQDLTRSVDELTALGEVGRAVSSTLDLETVLNTIVSRAIQLSRTDGGSVYEYDEATEEFSLRASRDLPEAYVEQVRDTRPRKGEGAVGRVAQTREPVQIADIADATAYESRVRNMLLQMGLRALLAVPLIAEDQLVGALIVMRKRTGAFAAEEVALLQTFATQSALAIQNARLFREIEDKSRQLEVASQHKSEFLANMSHELRTPLNAIIGFSEVLSEKMFGELNEKQEEYSKDIHASGQHLLSLINDILDLSKIEAGRMELELSDFHLPTALDSALTLVRERAGRRGISLQMKIDNRLGQIKADERKIRQVVLNLLSNAIKFTPEDGRIDVSAVPKDGFVEVFVSDTGVGIAPEDQEAVFEEFHQVGTADKKVEGTGLGLTLCRKFVELHGGKIWVKSELGNGSTFTFTIPVRRAE